MNGLLRRLTRRRAAPADETQPGSTADSEPVDATLVSLEKSGESPLSPEEQAREDELRRRRRDLPAGVDADQLEAAAGSRPGALRRRARYLRRVRELLLRDLGGFYYEVHRTAAGDQNRAHREILETKAARLATVDAELRALEGRLGQPQAAGTVVREPGIGGTCPTCGELHGSDAGWCSHCGTPLNERARRQREQDADRVIAERQARAQEAEQARLAAERAAAEPAPAAPLPAPAPDSASDGGDRPPATDPPTSELPAGNDSDPVTSAGERRP